MDHESSDDEDVYSFCKQLGIKIPSNKNKKNIFITTNNLENIDTNNLPVTILRRNDHNVCEHSEILQYHLMEIEANVSSPVLTSSINPQIEPQLPISMEVSSILEDLSSIQVSSEEWTIRYWLSTAALGMAKRPELTRNVVEGHSKKEEIDFLKNFFICLPKMPSHYCRASSTRQYLEPIIQNKNHLYKIYCNKCTEENRQIVSRWSFDRIFAEQNLCLFHPKKDQRDTCCSFKVGNISEEDYHKHISLKESARDEKNKDKIWALAGEIHLFTHDLQSVKLCPMLQASALYYKTKLCVHNFTMYNLATKDVHCYWFDEHNAGLVDSVFVRCIIDCLKKSLTDELKPIVLFSDGCTAQNRNAILANALLELAVEYKVVITQKVLEKGHTQMECDASHSAIECKIKNKEIYLPSQYALISKEARPKQPFIVNYLSYDFFDDYSNKKYYLYESIRPGRVANDPTVTDLRVLEYSPDGIIKYKLSFEDEYRELPRRPKTSQRKSGSKPKLYNSHLKINESKWKHLQELKTVIPSDCHSFYDSLLY